MKKIGITGGIGAGKTTVCRIFETLDVPIYYSDDRAKWLMDNDKTVIHALKNLFGDDIYDPENNLLRRAELGKLIFGNADLLAKINAIVHPAVAQDSDKWAQQNAQKPYILKESALIYEINIEKEFDAVIAVVAPVEVRIERVVARNGWARETILQRINAQLSDEVKAQRAHFVIENDGEKALIPQVMAIHAALLKA